MTSAGSWVGRAPSGGAGKRPCRPPGLRAQVSASQTHGAPCSSAGNGELCAQGSAQLLRTEHRYLPLGKLSEHVPRATLLQAALRAAFLRRWTDRQPGPQIPSWCSPLGRKAREQSAESGFIPRKPLSLAIPATNVWSPAKTIGYLPQIADGTSASARFQGILPQLGFKGILLFQTLTVLRSADA
eukprot:4254182-Amphidinium_carterae.2